MELIRANIDQLRLLQTTVETISEEHLVVFTSDQLRAPIAQHLRHVLNHYDILIEGLNSGVIDYEARIRGGLAEQSKAVTLQWLRRTIDALKTLPASPTQTMQLIECGGKAEVSTTLGRELAFLYSHTVHHAVLVRQLCEQAGYAVQEPLGFHPSTLRANQN